MKWNFRSFLPTSDCLIVPRNVLENGVSVSWNALTTERQQYQSLCQSDHRVLIFSSSAGSEGVQQMFPSVSVLWRFAVWGLPQLSQGSHLSIYSPLLICHPGTRNHPPKMSGFEKTLHCAWPKTLLTLPFFTLRKKKDNFFKLIDSCLNKTND